MPESNTSICNQALGGIGSTRINDFEEATEASPEAIHCRLHFAPVRDALLRSYLWRFARARDTLVQDDTDPTFDWDRQFILPNDFLRFRSIEEEDGGSVNHAIEGKKILTNFSTVHLRYIKKVTDASQFDPLFVAVFVLQLEMRLLTALAKTDPKLKANIKQELELLMPSVRAVDSDETNTTGRRDWNLARYG